MRKFAPVIALIMLSDMVPEKRAEITARAADYAHSRSVIAAVIMQRDDFKAEFTEARANCEMISACD